MGLTGYRSQIDEVKGHMPCIMELGNPAMKRGVSFES